MTQAREERDGTDAGGNHRRILASDGFLAKRLYVILTTLINGHGSVQAVSEEHLAHQVALEREGILFGAGPLLTDDCRYCEGEG